MSSNLAPHYDGGEEMEIDLGGKSTTSAMHSSDLPAVAHRGGAVPRGERCGRCFRNKCVRYVCIFGAHKVYHSRCLGSGMGWLLHLGAVSCTHNRPEKISPLRFNYVVWRTRAVAWRTGAERSSLDNPRSGPFGLYLQNYCGGRTKHAPSAQTPKSAARFRTGSAGFLHTRRHAGTVQQSYCCCCTDIVGTRRTGLHVFAPRVCILCVVHRHC